MHVGLYGLTCLEAADRAGVDNHLQDEVDGHHLGG